MKQRPNNWEPGKTEWMIENWEFPGNSVEPNPDKLCWKFLNPNKIHLDKVYLKVTRVYNGRTGEVTGRWKIVIDGESVDCVFDENYETEITGIG